VNIAQVLRLALYDAEAVNLDSTTHRFLVESELLAWAQEGHHLLYAKLRQANQDYGLVTRLSTDADLRWHGITYDCSTFGLTTTARTYILPPDLIELRQIRAITSGEEARQFEFRDMADPFVVEQIRAELTATGGTIYYDVVGERTLRLPQPPDVAMDIEISYIARPRSLFLYSTGTVSTTQNAAGVTGASTPNWVINELAPPCELMIATGAVAPKIVSATSTDPFVDPSALYSPVSSIDTDTTLTLAGAYLPASVSTKAYLLASVPSVPLEWQWVIVRWVVAMIRWKIANSPVQELPNFDTIMAASMMPSVTQRQTADAEYVEDYIP
jgi:hypothetical protein